MKTEGGRRRAGGAKAAMAGLAAILLGASSFALGVCGPFTDVAADGFCPFVLELFTLGITTGTSPTTYDPMSNVSRLQMAAFLSRTVDGALRRGSPRTAIKRLYTPQSSAALLTVSIGSTPRLLKSDGVNIWAASVFGDSVVKLRATDGANLGSWSVSRPSGVLVAMGRVFAAGNGVLSRIDPTQPPGPATAVASPLGIDSVGIAYDGSRIWTANFGRTVFEVPGGVSIVTPGATIPWTVTTLTAGFNSVLGILYDGSSIWATDYGAGTLLKLDPTGAILQTVGAGFHPAHPAFDGTNIWVPAAGGTVTVVRASTGAVLQVLTGNGLGEGVSAAFDGQRILVTNFTTGGVSLFKAADLTPLGSAPALTAGFHAYGACSDGVSFWVSGNDSWIVKF